MSRRSLYLIGILLLCFFIGACGKKDEIFTETNDDNKDREETFIEANDANSDREETFIETNDVNKDKDEIFTEVSDAIIDKDETLTETKDKNIDEVEAPREDVDTTMFMKVNNMKFNEDDKVNEYPAGTVIDVTNLDMELIDSLFVSRELNKEIINRIEGKSYKEGADISYSDLRYITVLHMGFDGKTHIGEMIVNKAIALDVIDIFKDLYKVSYPIEKMVLIDDYGADDIKSMEDNNSSSFNYRFVEGASRRSVHSDGLAIDINPLYNPYVRTRDGKEEVFPESGLEYTDRHKENEYYIRKGDPCYEAFVSRGFTWGGQWKNSKDYQHFEKKIVSE